MRKYYLIVQDFRLPAYVEQPMYDSAPESFTSDINITFQKGDVIELSEDFMPNPEHTDATISMYGGQITYDEPVPKDCIREIKNVLAMHEYLSIYQEIKSVNSEYQDLEYYCSLADECLENAETIEESIQTLKSYFDNKRKELTTEDKLNSLKNSLSIQEKKLFKKDPKDPMEDRINDTIKRNQILGNILKDYLENHRVSDLYEILQPYIDRDGFGLYHKIREKELVVEPSDYFYSEECMGIFENLMGKKLLEWAELAKFGELFYNYQGPYEILDRKKSFIDKENIHYKLYCIQKEKLMLDICLELKFPYQYYPKTNNLFEADINYEKDKLHQFNAADYYQILKQNLMN